MGLPRTYKTRGFVLRQTSLGEADRILTLFTRDLGKIQAVAKGIRRTKSKLSGHLEPFALASLSLSRGRQLDTIFDADTVNSFRVLREDLKRLSKAVYLIELVDKFTSEHQPSPEIYSLLLDSLILLEHSNDSDRPIIYFEVQILSRSGFGPELYRCVECSIALKPGKYTHSHTHGGLICNNCTTKPMGLTFALSVNCIKVLRFLANASVDSISSLKIPSQVESEATRLLRTYIRYILDRELKSVDFMALVASDQSRH